MYPPVIALLGSIRIPAPSPLTVISLPFLFTEYCFQEVVRLSMYVKEKYPNLHTGWYSGREVFPLHHGTFDYIKLGPWKEECGPLTSKTTNQVMYMKVDGGIDNPIFVDITKKAFQSSKPWETDYLENNDNV